MQGRGCQFGRLDDTRVVRERAKCELRIRYQPSDYSWTNIAGSARKITEKNPVLFLLLTKALDEMFCMWDVMRKDDCPVRLFAQRLAESLYLPFFFFLFFFTPLSAIDVSLVSGMKQNSPQLCSDIVCWLLWHNDLHFARHFGRD